MVPPGVREAVDGSLQDQDYLDEIIEEESGNELTYFTTAHSEDQLDALLLIVPAEI